MKFVSRFLQVRDVSTQSAGRADRFFWAKVVVTVAILGILLWRVDLSRVADALRGSLGIWFLLAFLSQSFLLVSSTYKWNGLLRALGISASTWVLLQFYTIGFFASSFLPGVVGGDVVRWHMVGQRTGGRLKVAATILAERVTGVAALVVLGLLAVAVAAPRLAKPPILFLLAAIALIFICGLALVLNRRLATALIFRTRHLRIRRVAQSLYKLHRTLRKFPRKPLVVALGYSVLFYLVGGLTLFLICLAFGANISFVEATSVQLLICVLTLIPVSVGGLGLTQAGDVYLLGLLGVSAPDALGISIARLLVNYGYAIIGGFLFIRWQAGGRADDAWNLRSAEPRRAHLVGSSTSALSTGEAGPDHV